MRGPPRGRSSPVGEEPRSPRRRSRSNAAAQAAGVRVAFRKEWGATGVTGLPPRAGWTGSPTVGGWAGAGAPGWGRASGDRTAPRGAAVGQAAAAAWRRRASRQAGAGRSRDPTPAARRVARPRAPSRRIRGRQRPPTRTDKTKGGSDGRPGGPRGRDLVDGPCGGVWGADFFYCHPDTASTHRPSGADPRCVVGTFVPVFCKWRAFPAQGKFVSRPPRVWPPSTALIHNS